VSRRNRRDERAARQIQEVTARAVRRLDVLEWVILAVAAAAATAAGALVAWLLAEPVGVAFRTLWIVASLVLFGVPGWLALRGVKTEDERAAPRGEPNNDGNHV